jgi:hypothetical protein
LDGALAELVGGEGDGLPFGAATFHKLSIIVQLDGEKYISILRKIIDIPAVKIDVDVLYFVSKNKNSGVVRAKNLLPPGQSIDIIGCNPALKAG